MKYVLIDNDGELHVKNGSYDEIRELFQPEGSSGVRLPSDSTGGFRGLVNDVSMLDPERFPRNIVGSLTLISLYASHQPYAGPIVITGFVTPVYSDPEHVSLDDDQVRLIRSIHADIRAALAGEGPPNPSEYTKATWEAYRATVVLMAEQLRDMPTRGVQILTGNDAAAFLRGEA